MINEHFRNFPFIQHQVCCGSDNITQILNIKKHTKLVLLDLEKATDTVWYNALLYKLIEIKFPSYLVQTARSCLSNRHFSVYVDNISSTIHPPYARIPQGSKTGPSLFILYLNHLLKITNTVLSLFQIIWLSSPPPGGLIL